MRVNFDGALTRLLDHEGGYSNHPSDPGGPTKFGITIADYRKYVKPDATAADVKRMLLGEAEVIYRQKYWNALRCDELPAGVDYTIFDYGVNSGIGRSGKVLRRVLGMADNTHVVTDAVLKAVAKHAPSELVIQINDERLRFLKRLKTWPVFGAGWGRRVAEVKAHSLKLANGQDRPKDRPIPPPPDIEPPEDRPTDKPPWWKRLWLRWTTGAGGVGVLTYLTEPWALLVLCGFVLLVAVLFIWFMGPSRVREWIRRQVNT